MGAQGVTGMLRACLIGAAVTFALIAVPVLHWLTFLPAPFIGGYVAGARTGATGGGPFIVGSFMGVLLIVPVSGILSLSSVLFLDLTVQQIAVVAGIYATYVAALATLGAARGGASSRRQLPT